VVEAEERLRKKLLKKQEELESREKALAASQAEARTQVKHLADLQQKAQEQSLALAQAQATLQAQVHSQREETNHLIQTVQQQSELAQRRLVETAQRQVEEVQEKVAAGLGGATSPELHQRLGRLEALLEGRFSETLKAMTSQSEERAAYIAALADQRSAPMQMLPLCIPPPPQPVAPPAPPKVSVAAQTTQDQENRKEHEARVDRFTHYLLHGPPGARDSKPPEPRLAVRNTHAEALLALSLRAMTPKVDKENMRPMSSRAASSTSDSEVNRLDPASPGECFEPSSRGEVRRQLVSSPGETKLEHAGEGSASEGEVRHGPTASSGEVSDGELEAKEDSDACSSGEVDSLT